MVEGVTCGGRQSPGPYSTFSVVCQELSELSPLDVDVDAGRSEVLADSRAKRVRDGLSTDGDRGLAVAFDLSLIHI